MFDLAAFDAEIARQNRAALVQDDALLTQAIRPAEEEGIKQIGVTSAMIFAVAFGAIQGSGALFSATNQASASMDPSGLETYAMHLDAPQTDHDLLSLFDSLNRS